MSLHLVDVLLPASDGDLQVSDSTLPGHSVYGTAANHLVTMSRQGLFTTLIPIFLGNHPNSGTILHHANSGPTATGSAAPASWPESTLYRFCDGESDLPGTFC
ncbi:uncharacterized protein LOC119769564 [Culex quinquefasciatus]|uniref:uncharacterized protein LOC119769564 n=1 Tax=Culex quinquefasciatus TaxID=7176 RepID=UPI0018E378E2|nr:uncharacterized protein LOC119769564 [Culex quinquefasciatus]